MKPTTPLAATCTFALLLSVLAQPALTAGEIRERITPAQMLQRQASTEWKSSEEGGAPRDPRAKSPAKQSVIEQSVILCDGTYWTLVPIGSVLHVPAKHQDRVVKQPAGKLLNWQQFLGRNRSWLGTEDVDIATAAGQTPITKEAESTWAQRGSVVVAVHRGGAISVKRPEPEAETKAAPAAKPEKS